jgi:H+/Cl- antiporter ClcA
VSTPMLTREEQRVSPPAALPIEDAEAATARRRHIKRLRRLELHIVAWTIGTIAVTAAWITHEWSANGAFQRFAHEGNSGDWNPTLWALVVLLWGLAVGILALRAYFERPPTVAQVEREVVRLKTSATYAGTHGFTALHRRARARLDRVGRLKFHAAAWVLGMIVLAPVNVLIEWQDNGRFERLSGNSQPGSWDPWALIVGGIWALVVAVVFALPVILDRRKEQ